MFMMNKNKMRDFYLKIRNNISKIEKELFDKIIYIKFINSSFFNDYELFCVYISVKNEVDTFEIIRYLLDNNKNVAIPYCSGKKMEFYKLKSIDDLTEGKFGIPTVDINNSEKIEIFNNALCIVPAVSFDNNGNRIGYGGGYYDRFLSENNIPTLGLCYERCIADYIPNDSFDIKIDCVLTENHLRNHKIKEVSTYG